MGKNLAILTLSFYGFCFWIYGQTRAHSRDIMTLSLLMTRVFLLHPCTRFEILEHSLSEDMADFRSRH